MARVKENCKEVKYLKGPVTLSILENKDSKIVLLGDYHMNEPKCSEKSECEMELPLYLEQLFMTYDGKESINFFLEVDFEESMRRRLSNLEILEIKNGKIIKNYINTIAIYFSDCFEKLKHKCKFSNIKFHYSDVRHGVIHTGTADEEKVVLKDIYNLHAKLSNKNITQADEIKYYKSSLYLMNKYLDKNNDKKVNFFFEYSKIDKQLKNVDNKIVKILRFMLLESMKDHEDTIKIFQLNLIKVLTYMEQIKNTSSNDKEPFENYPIKNINQAILHMGLTLSILFDIYTLARMLKHNMKNVIIYAGDLHITNIKKFLIDELDYNEVVHKTSNQRGKHFQCINMKDVPQPWFGKVEKSGKKY